MRKIILAAVFVSLSGLANAKIVDKTIAKVNGQAIFLSEFEKNLNAVLEVQSKAVPKDEQTPEWLTEQKKAVLKQMIDDKILVQEAKNKNIKVNKRDLDEGVKDIKNRFKRDETGRELSDSEVEKAFQAELKKEGLTAQAFEDKVKDQISVMKLIEDEVKKRITPPSEEETKHAFESALQISSGKTPAGLDKEEVKEYESLSKYIEEKSAERVSARHILVRVDRDAPKYKKDEALKKIKDVRAKAAKGEDFGELAEKYSDDTESAKRGGFLGAFVRGWMVPEFEKAAFKLNVGEMSDVVETEYGYHIIKVEEKKAAQKAKFEEVKNEVAEFLYRIKLKKRYDLWIEALNKRSNTQILEPELK